MGIQDEFFERAFRTCFQEGPITSITYGEPEKRIVAPIFEKHAELFAPGLRFQIEANAKLPGHPVAMNAVYDQKFPCDLEPMDKWWSTSASSQRRLVKTQPVFCFLTAQAVQAAIEEFRRKMGVRKRLIKSIPRGTAMIFEVKRGEQLAELTLCRSSVDALAETVRW